MSDWSQCCLVEPYWIHIGWVKWQGAAEREKLFCIEYRRCTRPSTDPVVSDGFTYHWCEEHRAERAK